MKTIETMSQNFIETSFNENEFKHLEFIMNDSTCLQKGIVNEKTILRYEDTYENIGEHNCEDDKEDLYSKFQEIVGPKTCYPEHPQHTTHISDLPLELIVYVMKVIAYYNWNELTVLDHCAAVCRGWYLCARDPIVCRQACLKFWSINSMDLSKYGGSWRRMLLERPHILTIGCYIAVMDKTCTSHKRYFYLRFFPDGRVIRMASSICPAITARYLQEIGEPPSDASCDTYVFFDDKLFVKFNMNQKWPYYCDDSVIDSYGDTVIDTYDDYDRVLEGADGMIFEILKYKSIRYGKLRCLGIKTICQRKYGVSISLVHLNLPQFMYSI